MQCNHILVVDDEQLVRDALTQTLKLEDFEVSSVESAELALETLSADWPGIVISDINMPGMDGIELLHKVCDSDDPLPMVMLTGHGNISLAVDAMRKGAYDFLEKPFSNDILIETVTRALEKRSLSLENRALKKELESYNQPGPRLIGKHSSMAELRGLLDAVKNADIDVLINGDTGTGKEMVARYLHQQSKRHEKPFVAINCAALPENIIESELFGHEPGAFTGATKRRAGKFEHANGGTLFLDEIESMPLSLQAKILRVLEDRVVEPLGGNRLIKLDIRILAATKESLQELSDKGAFRTDLYYRLNVVQVHIPLLRERGDDIILLFLHFVNISASRYSVEVPSLSAVNRQRLLQHDWPGNVRQLRNMADCFVLLGEERAFGQDLGAEQSQNWGEGLLLAEQLDRFEEAIIRSSLTEHHGRLKDVQECLGIGRKTLYEKMKKYDLDKNHFKLTTQV